MTSSPRPLRFGPSDVEIERRPDGTMLVRSAHALGPIPERITDVLDHWARTASYRTFLAQRDARGHWRNITYAEAQYFGRRIGQALLNRGLSVERPILILSGNDIEHALLGIGAMYAGIPYAPISPAYSLDSTNFEELRAAFELMTPGLVFVTDGKKFEQALNTVMPADCELVVGSRGLPGSTPYSALVNTELAASIEAAHAHVHANTVCKILFTRGSTGMRKGVINTHRMWLSNQEMARHHFPFLADEPPVLVDCEPWHHTSGGNSAFGLVLYNGGSLYIDEGRPTSGLFDATLRNLRAIAPTMYWNEPQAFELLIPHLREDEKFRKHFFSRMKLLRYEGAGLSQEVWDDFVDISRMERGEPIPLLTGLGTTETAPHVLFGPGDSARPGLLGVPAPGVELKLVPTEGGKLEARLRGPNVTFGYWRRLSLSRAAFDEEGFFKLGDTLRFVDEQNPSLGFVFDGRLV